MSSGQELDFFLSYLRFYVDSTVVVIYNFRDKNERTLHHSQKVESVQRPRIFTLDYI